MSFFQRVRSIFAATDAAAAAEIDAAPEIVAAEEFQKIQRSVRRLSMASDRSGEILQTVSERLNDIQQTLLKMTAPPRQTALALEEAPLLGILDRLDHAARVPELPDAARSAIEGVKQELLAGARWRSVARSGDKPEGADIRIAEFLDGAGANEQAEAFIHRVLEQGYRRADGTLLRPGVVVAAAGDAAVRAANQKSTSSESTS